MLNIIKYFWLKYFNIDENYLNLIKLIQSLKYSNFN